MGYVCSALRTIHLINQIGGTEGYLKSLEPIDFEYDTSPIDAKAPGYVRIPLRMQAAADTPWRGFCKISVETIPDPPIGATTYHGTGIVYAPDAISVTVPDGWALYFGVPWTLEKLIQAGRFKFQFKADPKYPGTIDCHLLFGCVRVATISGPLEEKDVKALDGKSGSFFWLVFTNDTGSKMAKANAFRTGSRLSHILLSTGLEGKSS